MVVTTLTLSLFISPLYGALGDSLVGLSREFLEKNPRILRLKEIVRQEEFNYGEKVHEKRWQALAQTAYSNDQMERSPQERSFFENRRHEYGLDFRRDFATGGSFTLSQGFSGLTPRSSALRETSYEFVQGLSYSQDLGANFLGRNYRSELARARLNLDYSSSLREAGIQEELHGFASSYTDLKLHKTLLVLQDQAVERAKRRVSFVRQRVTTGLKERVDLYQSQMDLLSREEEKRSLLADIVSGLATLSREIGREVEDREVDPFSLEEKAREVTLPPAGSVEGNLTLKSRKIEEKRRREDLTRAQQNLWPKVNLGLNYRINDYDPRASRALSRGHLAGPERRDFFSLEASLVMPLGLEREKSRIGRVKSEIRVAEAEYSLEKQRVAKEESVTLYRLSEMEERINSAQRRRELARLSLGDYNNLYTRGLADLDQVIRAEEDLINTQRSLAQYATSRQQLHLRLGLLYGNLLSYILRI